MIRFGNHYVRGFALSGDESTDDLVATKLAEGGYPDVSAYQAANSLPVDGDAGHDTLTKMGYGYLYDLAGQGKLKPGQTQLPTKKTPLTPEQAAQALSAGYQAVEGKPPTPEVLALLIAQSGHETTDWRDISNYAFGGVKASSGDKYVQAMRTTEGTQGKHYVLAFAAYPTAAEGAAAYIRVLKHRDPWWAGLQSGVPETFVNALRSIQGAWYFTGSQTDYLASVQARVAKFADLARKYASQVATSDIASKVYKALAPLDVIAMARREIAPPPAVTSVFREATSLVDWVQEHKMAIAIGAAAVVVAAGVVVVGRR
jgi:hypothetical protein